MEEKDSIIRQALDRSGYGHVHESEEALIECFKDYVDSGIWQDLTLDDINDITIEEMCRALMNIRHS